MQFTVFDLAMNQMEVQQDNGSGGVTTTLSFKPDMSDEPHTPATYSSGADALYSLNGTKMTDVWRHNPHVGYKVCAVLNGRRLHTATIQMDEIDVLRQEYNDHNASAGTSIAIPGREKFKLLSEMPPGQWASSSPTRPYAYQYILNDGIERMWNVISARYATARKNQYNSLTVPSNVAACFHLTC